MDKSKELIQKLETETGVNVYLHSYPPNHKLSYPVMILKRRRPIYRMANNFNYTIYRKYELMIMTNDVNSDLPYKIEELLPQSEIEQEYLKDGIYHSIIEIVY